MADIFSKAKRSQIMARVRSRHNRSTEGRFVNLLRSAGITGWRRGYPLVGRPDFVFTKQRLAVFIDGCFWHRHRCTRRRIPKSRIKFWLPKLERNVARD